MGRGVVVALAVAGALVMPAGAEGALRAGAASADITPPVGTPMFAYTARSALASPDKLPDLAMQLVADPPTGSYAKTFVPSRGIHTRVRARALVLDAGDGPFALVQADLGGVPHLLTQEVLRRIAPTGITADRLLLSASHTHASTGPIWPTDSTGYALLGGDLFDPRVFDLTAGAIAEAVRDAHARLRPAKAGVGRANVTGASRNRNFAPFRANADVPQDEGAARAASIEPQLTVLRVDTTDGRPIAAWSNFAIHPTSFGDGNLLFSGDNAGYAERVAEQTIARLAARGGRPPIGDVVNVWTNGAEGDISPNGSPDGELQWVPNDFASAHLAGVRVGRGTVRAWEDAGRRLRTDLALDARRTSVGFTGAVSDGERVGPMPVLGLGGVAGPDGACAPGDGLAGPGQGRKVPLLAGPGIAPATAPVSLLRVGDLGIAAYPAEITHQMGRRIREAVREAAGGLLGDVVIAGLTNAYVSYTATPEEYDRCHYEGSFTLYGRRQGARLRDAGRALADALASGRPAPGGAPPVPVFRPPGGGGGAPRDTPDAGEIVAQPAERVARHGVVTFRWRGGDPQVDAPRGRTFVALQRRASDGWETVATDDGFQDTVERSAGDVWTARHQLTECDALGVYRFRVTGRAAHGPYHVTSREFAVDPVSLNVHPLRRTPRTVQVVATYPDPGEDVLLALPRRVRSGVATLQVGGRRVRARMDRSRLRFARRVPFGVPVRVLAVRDGCGNRG